MQAVVLSIAFFSCLPVFNAQEYKVVYKRKLGNLYYLTRQVGGGSWSTCNYNREFKILTTDFEHAQTLRNTMDD